MNQEFKAETFRDDFTFRTAPKRGGGSRSHFTKTNTCMRSI